MATSFSCSPILISSVGAIEWVQVLDWGIFSLGSVFGSWSIIFLILCEQEKTFAIGGKLSQVAFIYLNPNGIAIYKVV